MISDSIGITVFIDFVIIIIAIYSVVFAINYYKQAKKIGFAKPMVLLMLGIGITALFYTMELFSMFVAPDLIGRSASLKIMLTLRQDWSWLSTLISMLAIATGLTFLVKKVIPQLDISNARLVEKISDVEKLNSQLEERSEKLAQANEISHAYSENLEKAISELKSATTQLRLEKDKADSASHAKTEFLSRMSHELRTPMNAILGFAQILKFDADGFDKNQLSSVNEILAAGRHLLELINEVLDLAKIESGNVDISMGEVTVSELLQQCIPLILPQAEMRQVELIDQLSSKHLTVHADFTKLKQVLLNLLTNAVKYNSDNGRITLSGELISDHYLRILVSDLGEGLSEKDMEVIFRPFERLHVKENVEGTGIGLTISKYLIESMNGKIGVDSKLGEGSTFWLDLEVSKVA